MSLSADIAGRLGRLSLVRGGASIGTSSDRGTSPDISGPGLSLSAASELSLGKLASGELGLIVIGLVLFYAWTRSHQA